MKAVVCKKFAPVSELVWEEVADPIAGPGEIIIDIKAAGLNYPDNLIVQGLYQFQPERPFSPGHEGSGVVSSVGAGVKMHNVGDSVAFFKGFGAFAEKIVVSERMAFPVPKNFPHKIAAGVFMVYGTTRVSGIVEGQNEYWFGNIIPMWGVFTQPLGFVLFFTALVAETKRAPFDAPEGESEIVAGYFLEYSGMRWSAFMLAEYVALVGVASLITTLFFGGYHVPWLHLWEDAPQWIVTIMQLIKFSIFTVFFCWFQIQLRWTVPKFRFDQTMALGWKKLLPLSLANVFVTAFVILAFG